MMVITLTLQSEGVKEMGSQRGHGMRGEVARRKGLTSSRYNVSQPGERLLNLSNR